MWKWRIKHWNHPKLMSRREWVSCMLTICIHMLHTCTSTHLPLLDYCIGTYIVLAWIIIVKHVEFYWLELCDRYGLGLNCVELFISHVELVILMFVHLTWVIHFNNLNHQTIINTSFWYKLHDIERSCALKLFHLLHDMHTVYILHLHA